MKANRHNRANKQPGKGDKAPGAGSTADNGKLNPSQQGSGTLSDSSSQQGSGQRQGAPEDRAAAAVGGGMPMSPAGNRQAADEKMDDDTGLSNTANRPASEPDPRVRQERQSNVGRRDDGTPD
jgi:hypothetical protein